MTNEEKIEELRKLSYSLIEARDKALEQAPHSTAVKVAVRLSERTLASNVKRIALLQLKDPKAAVSCGTPRWVCVLISMMAAYVVWGQFFR